MRPTPTLTTPRLSLAPLAAADAADVFAYAANPAVARHTTWVPHRTVDDAASFIGRVSARPAGHHCWAIRLSGRPAVVGVVELGPTDAARAEVHYVLAEPCWGRGLMTEAVRAVLAWGFAAHPNLARVTTGITAANAASRRVAEKCGLVLTGVHREEWAKFTDPVEVCGYAVDRRTA